MRILIDSEPKIPAKFPVAGAWRGVTDDGKRCVVLVEHVFTADRLYVAGHCRMCMEPHGEPHRGECACAMFNEATGEARAI